MGDPEVRGLVAAHLPGYQVDSVVLAGAGQENTAYEVNGELIVRVSKEPDPARRAVSVQREARLLTTVAGISPLPVPEPRFIAPEQGCLAYRKVPGRSLLELPGRWAHGTSIAATLGGFLAAPPPAGGYTLVFSHNDLGVEHVLVDPAWTVTGVIDWTDAALVDPAYDFGLLYRDLGPDAVDAAVRTYRTSVDNIGALRERAAFYARCSVLEDLAYGLGSGQTRYVDNSIAALAWLFPV